MVALQGTLDTFALADVLRLLASTKKTGRLRVTGDRGSGSVWVDDGRVVGTELVVPGPTDDTPVEALYHLLRFHHGSFTFEPGATPSAPGTPLDVEPLLRDAELLLDEWRAIESVVPSLDAWLSLRPELAGDVVVDGSRWRVIAAVAGGASAGAVGEALGMGEMTVLRATKELVELGLVEVGDAPAGFGAHDPNPFPSESHGLPRGEDAGPPLVERAPAPPSLTEMRSGLGTVGLSEEEAEEEAETGEHDTPFDVPAAEPRAAAPPPEVVPPPMTATAPTTQPEPSLEDAAEIARQLANLSPRAAKAVAAAAKATTDEEREAALAAIEAEDETVNRGLLLRFLGSVDS